MSRRGFPFGLLLVTSATMVWLLSRPIVAHAASHSVECPLWLLSGSVPSMARRGQSWKYSIPDDERPHFVIATWDKKS